MLWGDEKELAMEENLILIPQIKPNQLLNERLNSYRRLV